MLECSKRCCAPNKTVASPVLRASETRYFCDFNVKVLSPFSSTWHTRLQPGGRSKCQCEWGVEKEKREGGEGCSGLQVGSAEIECKKRAVKFFLVFGVRYRANVLTDRKRWEMRYPVSVPSGTPVTNVGLVREKKGSIDRDRDKLVSHKGTCEYVSKELIGRAYTYIIPIG